jgi:hypothetical protein
VTGANTPAPLGKGRERERAGRGGETAADRWSPPVRRHGSAWPRWAGLGRFGLKWIFSFSREFLLPFIFIFFRVFISNSNQVSNSNQIKHVHQFKEYFVLSMMQQIMTHISFDKNK